MLRGLAQHTRETILPEAEREMARTKAVTGMTLDMGREWFESLETMATRLSQVAETMGRRVLRLEAQRHTEKFMAAAKRALGIDLSAVVREEDLETYLENAATRNVGLIRNLAQDVVQRVQRTVTTALISGTPVKTLRTQLTEQFGFTDRRAKLIARDQIAKLNSDLNRERHTQAGVTSYTWMTAADERVRPLHRSLDGKVYEYGKPTGAEQGLPPGQPINCRCVARGIVEF
jgi:SPP1 gp7 family putative phage head morphogenesis protein